MALLLCVFMARCIIVKHKGTLSWLGLLVCLFVFFFFYRILPLQLYTLQYTTKIKRNRINTIPYTLTSDELIIKVNTWTIKKEYHRNIAHTFELEISF